jgi:hypothetical protein
MDILNVLRRQVQGFGDVSVLEILEATAEVLTHQVLSELFPLSSSEWNAGFFGICGGEAVSDSAGNVVISRDRQGESRVGIGAWLTGKIVPIADPVASLRIIAKDFDGL